MIQFAADWEASDATTETYVYIMALPGSQLENGSENTNPAGLQSSQRLAQIKMAPPVNLADLEERNRWSRPHSVEIEIRYVGSPRVIDLTIWEVPNFWIAEADDADDEWTQHVFAIGKPDDEGVRTKWPVDEREDTGAGDRDQRIGTLQCLRVAENQRKRFGPALFFWGAYMENAGAVTDTALPFITIGTAGSATWVNALNTSQGSTASSPAAFDPSEPGWSMGCAGYARSWLHNNTQVLPNTPYATVPVLVRVYCQNNDNTAVSARFHTAPDDATTDMQKFSWIDVTIPASMGAAAWVEAWGYLQVGVNPEQHVVGQLMVLQQTAGVGMDLDIYAIQAYVWDGTYAPT